MQTIQTSHNKNLIFCAKFSSKSIDRTPGLWYNVVTTKGEPILHQQTEKERKTMLKYFDGQKRVPVTNKRDIKRWHEINNALMNIEDPDDFEEFLDIMGEYMWNRTRQTAGRLYSFLARNKIQATPKEIIFLWEPIEDWPE